LHHTDARSCKARVVLGFATNLLDDAADRALALAPQGDPPGSNGFPL
jgi:hypothetical protein